MGTPYIGSHISLISKNDIRYEGTLYTIDTKESNIALAKVKSFGTEGRRLNGPQIAPGNDIYEYIIFRGSDIKDLKVLSSKSSSSEEPKEDVGRESQVPSTASPVEENLQANVGKGVEDVSKNAVSASVQPIEKTLPGDILPMKPAATLTKDTTEKKAWTGKQASEQLGAISASNGAGGRQYESRGRGRSRGRGGYRGNGRPYDRQQVPDIVIPSEDFDFNKMFAQFKKEEVYKELDDNDTSQYNKDDFFDSMSSDNQKSKERPNFHEIRKIDSETFGVSAQRGRRGGRGGHRGRGRGGRGGRGRGGRGRGHYRDARNREDM